MAKNKLVLIRTFTGMFDCVGTIKSIYTDKQFSYKEHYLVEVSYYTKGDYSKKEQKFYFSEVKEIVGDIDHETVKMLYTGD